MTKQQLRESIRRIINQELNETTYPKAGEKGNIKVSQLKKGDILGGSGLEVISISAGAKTPSGKVEVTVKDPKTGKELTKTWGKTTIVKVKDKTNENAPAPSKPATAPGVKEPPSKTPGKKEPRRPLGNPHTKPDNIPAKAGTKTKATMKEAEMLKQVIKRFKSKKMNEEAEQKYSYGTTQPHKDQGDYTIIVKAYPDPNGKNTKEQLMAMVDKHKNDEKAPMQIKFFKSKQEAGK